MSSCFTGNIGRSSDGVCWDLGAPSPRLKEDLEKLEYMEEDAACTDGPGYLLSTYHSSCTYQPDTHMSQGFG